MQVKKFEARTMKEALEMIKSQLGPDAIILQVRDHKRSYGLVGEGSVEITAAVSDDTLHKKKFAESRLRNEDRERLTRSSAKVQRQVIDKMVNRYNSDKESKESKPITRTRYIDIDDSVEAENFSADSLQLASERIKQAAQQAWSTMQNQQDWIQPKNTAQTIASKFSATAAKTANRERETAAAGAGGMMLVPSSSAAVATVDSTEVSALKGEIESLKQVLAHFQQVPQAMMNGQHPGSDFGLCYDVSSVYEKLTVAGVAPEIAAEMLTKAQEEMPPMKLKNKDLVGAWAAKYILDSTLICKPLASSAGVGKHAQIQLFVGSSGSGKTATLVKWASHLVVRERKKVAIVTTDNLKVGAADQMRIYAQILNVPFAVIRQKSDWERVMAQVGNYDYILADFPGLSMKTMEEISWYQQMIPEQNLGAQVHLVLSCLAKDSDLTEIGKRYKVTHYQDVIFSALDESIQHGTIYNFMKRFQVPLHSFGLGNRIPEDFELATRERVLDLIFKITKMNK